MIDRLKSRSTSRHLVLTVIFLLTLNISLGYLLLGQTKSAIITLMQTRMLDVSNTAAAMIDGDELKRVTPEDKGTPGYETIMRTLTYFQDNVDLRYIYCVRDMGDGTFTFGLDPTVEDPGEFGSPIVYTDALHAASRGTPSVDREHYEDAWGSFYSAYSPVYDSRGDLAGIIAVDFSAEWYNEQLALLNRTLLVVGLVSLLVGGAIVLAISLRSQRKIEMIHGQLSELETSLMQEIGSASRGMEAESVPHGHDEDASTMDGLEKQIHFMQQELRTQIAHVHDHAYQDGLTGVKSKQAYLETEKLIDGKMAAGEAGSFAVVVCDVNGLKAINDTMGHKAGDEYILKASRMIREIFPRSPVYRVGGDEFALILTGEEYEEREQLMDRLHSLSSANISTREAIVSGGMSAYCPEQDRRLHEVFERADRAMYEEKLLLKSLGASMREEEPQRLQKQDVDFEDLLASTIRRRVLIVEDIEIDRRILENFLAEDYDPLFASDGVEAMELLRSHQSEIALMLLDLSMPILSGREVLREMQVDESLMHIPVIVLTSDRDAELECLKLGAMDFISKPFPDTEILRTRIAKCIELSENRDLVRYTQRDKLTGLFNIDYFMRFVSLVDRQDREAPFDAIALNINEFHSVNERYGRQFGDLVLRSIGSSMKSLARKTGGICCRRGGDTFLLYCPHREDHGQLLRKFMAELFVEKGTASKVRLRIGVFPNAGREEDAEKRFACALQAAESVRNDPQGIFGVYEMREG